MNCGSWLGASCARRAGSQAGDIGYPHRVHIGERPCRQRSGRKPGAGNNDNRTVDVTTNGDTYIIPNGDNDQVLAQNSVSDTIFLGSSNVGPHIGNNDFLNADNSSFDTIVLGNGAGCTVSAQSSIQDTITVGDGNNDSVNAVGSSGILGSPYLITLGEGNKDS